MYTLYTCLHICNPIINNVKLFNIRILVNNNNYNSIAKFNIDEMPSATMYSCGKQRDVNPTYLSEVIYVIFNNNFKCFTKYLYVSGNNIYIYYRYIYIIHLCIC